MDFSKYPRTKQIMDETGMTLEQVFIWVETECRKKGVK